MFLNPVRTGICDKRRALSPFRVLLRAKVIRPRSHSMAPRGVSAEEKRVRLLEIFHESKDFYQLKELEKLAPKLKGIVSQSVKDVLQSLVDDGLVQGDKIGSSNFFWSFPSQRGAMMHNRLATVKENQTSLQSQLKDLRTTINAETLARPESEERKAALSQLSAAQRELGELEVELSQYGACDPIVIEDKKRAVILAKEACMRWTDDYVILLSYFTRQHGVDSEEVRKHLGVEEDYEDIL
ncbi:Mnd1 family-domain-containing protein [Cristinia sonorae]|uniref:Mnd1 family-domain-containing protein n=1 Tax=Cristinia sonorae TaxID=1940300 RepID=A0A8K0UEV4_9AGAR|nr:Mnd1 family-domain-containing protein [Cristinia sonorae]